MKLEFLGAVRYIPEEQCRQLGQFKDAVHEAGEFAIRGCPGDEIILEKEVPSVKHSRLEGKALAIRLAIAGFAVVLVNLFLLLPVDARAFIGLCGIAFLLSYWAIVFLRGYKTVFVLTRKRFWWFTFANGVPSYIAFVPIESIRKVTSSWIVSSGTVLSLKDDELQLILPTIFVKDRELKSELRPLVQAQQAQLNAD